MKPGKLKQQVKFYCRNNYCGASGASKIEFTNDLLRVARMLGHRPSQSEYKEFGKLGFGHFRKYGGYRLIWESLGLTWKDRLGVKVPATKKSLIADLQSVRAKLGRIPSSKDYKLHGIHSRNTFYSAFNNHNWHEILISVFELNGYQAAFVTLPYMRTLDMWLDLLRGLAIELKRPPRITEAMARFQFRQHRYAVLERRSYKSLLQEAGLDSTRTAASKLTTDEEILADFIRVAKKIGDLPSYESYNRFGMFSHSTVVRRIGWVKAKELAVQQLQPKPQPIKHLPQIPDPSRERLKESSVEAIKDFFRPSL